MQSPTVPASLVCVALPKRCAPSWPTIPIHICDVYPSFVDTPGLSHGANYAGKKIAAPPPLVDPRRVAEAVYRLADHPQATTMVGASTAAVRMSHFLAPNLNARAMDVGLKRYFETAENVPVSDGNLFSSLRPPILAESMAACARPPPGRLAPAWLPLPPSLPQPVSAHGYSGKSL